MPDRIAGCSESVESALRNRRQGEDQSSDKAFGGEKAQLLQVIVNVGTFRTREGPRPIIILGTSVGRRVQGEAEKEIRHSHERVHHQQNQAREDQPAHDSSPAALQLREALLAL